MRAETFKEKRYFIAVFPPDATVLNELRLDQASRVAFLLNDRYLATLKALASPLKGLTGIDGAGLDFPIAHKSFLDDRAKPTVDRVQLYVPAETLRHFADADITSQQLVDGSVLLVNGTRVQLQLAR